MLDIYTDMDWALFQMMQHCLMEMTIIGLQRAKFKDTLKIKVKKLHGRLVHFPKFNFSNS